MRRQAWPHHAEAFPTQVSQARWPLQPLKNYVSSLRLARIVHVEGCTDYTYCCSDCKRCCTRNSVAYAKCGGSTVHKGKTGWGCAQGGRERDSAYGSSGCCATYNGQGSTRVVT